MKTLKIKMGIAVLAALAAGDEALRRVGAHFSR